MNSSHHSSDRKDAYFDKGSDKDRNNTRDRERGTNKNEKYEIDPYRSRHKDKVRSEYRDVNYEKRDNRRYGERERYGEKRKDRNDRDLSRSREIDKSFQSR